MAQLKKPEPLSGFNIDALCPPGQYVAVCLEVQDLFGVTRKKFQSEETEEKDITRFVFGVLDQAGNAYLVQTFEMTIASSPGSNLMKFLTSWLGQAPQFGWDYCELKGSGAMISVASKESKGQPPVVYSVINGIFPVPAQLVQSIPDPGHFAALLVKAAQGQAQSPAPAAGLPAPAAQPAPAPPGQTNVPQALPVAQPAPATAPAPTAQPEWDPNATEGDDIPF